MWRETFPPIYSISHWNVKLSCFGDFDNLLRIETIANYTQDIYVSMVNWSSHYHK